MKMIAKFSKRGDLRFCSHLDMQRLFMRAISRGKVPVKFSQGFNRHPNISMAMALGLGQESISEYMEIELEREITPEDFCARMNSALPKDVQILECRLITGNTKALMALVYCAKYEIVFDLDKNLTNKTNEILQKDVIIINKKTKTKNVPTDIRPLILEAVANGNVVECVLRCGLENLKPKDFADLYGDDLDYSILRTGLMFYSPKDNIFSDLINL